MTIADSTQNLTNSMAAYSGAAKKRILSQNPNLLFNGSGEFGNKNWTLGAFASQNDAAGGTGYFFTNGAALSNLTETEKSPNVLVGANVQMAAAIDIVNGATAGSLVLALYAYSASNALLGAVGSTTTVTNGSALQRVVLSGTTPANTSYVQVQIVLTGVTAPVNGIKFKRIKVENGLVATVYSQEASLAQVPLIPGPSTYDLHNFINGKPLASEVIMRAVAVRAFTMAQNFPSSFAYCSVAPTAQFIINVLKNGAQVGTITFAANALSGTFASSSALTFNPGDTFTLQCQGTADSTLSDLTIGILGTSS